MSLSDSEETMNTDQAIAEFHQRVADERLHRLVMLMGGLGLGVVVGLLFCWWLVWRKKGK